MTDAGRALLQVRGLRKAYGATPVFADVTLSLQRGEFVALLGESGVGKSTLLNCIAGLDTADAGTVWLAGGGAGTSVGEGQGEHPDDGHDVLALTEPEQARLRRERLGFVFQAFHVLPHLSVAHNVALPLLLLGRPDEDRVMAMLAAVGLADLARRMPAQLSGGQLQRVALARALVHRPPLLLADEPTGNLDPATAARVLDLLVQQVRQQGTGCLLVTHSAAAAARADRRLRLTAQGIVAEASPPPPVATGSPAC